MWLRLRTRYTISLRDGTLLALKRANLLQMLSVRLEGLDGDASTHNGVEGTIFEYNDAAEMYGVELASGDAIPVPVGCAVLPEGTVGTVAGLQSAAAAHYNGALAKVISHDADAGRYEAVLDGGKTLRLKRQCLLA